MDTHLLEAKLQREWSHLREERERVCQIRNDAHNLSQRPGQCPTVARLHLQRKVLSHERRELKKLLAVCKQALSVWPKLHKLERSLAEFGRKQRPISAQVDAMDEGRYPVITGVCHRVRGAHNRHRQILARIQRDIDSVKRTLRETAVVMQKAWQTISSLLQQVVWYERYWASVVFFLLWLRHQLVPHRDWRTRRARHLRAYCIWRSRRCDFLLLRIDRQLHQRYEQLRREAAKASVVVDRHLYLVLRWAAQDQVHLTWSLANTDLDRSSVLRLYYERYPERAVVERGLAVPVSGPTVISRRRRRCEQVGAPAGVLPESQTSVWSFTLHNDTRTEAWQLPSLTDQSLFVKRLADLLEMLDLHVSADRIVDKLCHLQCLPRTQLRRWKQVSHADPVGWKIIRVGRHRILLDITEQDNQVSVHFLVRYRKEAYS